VVVKMNPVDEVYGPVIEQVFAPLIDAGFVRFVYGGADIGAALVHDDLVERVHMTGGAHTYDAIMWGTGPEADERRHRGEPLLAKPFTAELGGVGPTIVVPGRWSRADINLQAQVVATQKLNHSGHVCAASQVLVLPESWPQAEEFLAAVRAALAAAPHRESFYPGTQDKLPGDTPESFLSNAIGFANDRLTGNLSANLIIDPATAKGLGPRLEDRVADLRAGSIGINAWSVLAGVIGRCPWGAYPGNTPTDIQSGIGTVHNALMFPQPQKNVLWAGFRPTPPLTRGGQYLRALKPFWLVDNELTIANARALVDFYANPTPRTLLAALSSLFLPLTGVGPGPVRHPRRPTTETPIATRVMPHAGRLRSRRE
jgi:aldehyde dehydrogenase (NAD(P)+)